MLVRAHIRFASLQLRAKHEAQRSELAISLPGLGQAQTFSACSKAQTLIKVLQAVSTFQALIYNVLKYFLKHFQSASSTN